MPLVELIPVRVATVNDDFTDKLTNLRFVAPHADVMLTQENKHDSVPKLLPSGWYCFQVRSTASTRGSAVCWRPQVFRSGSTDQRVAARGKGILPRRFTIVHGRVGTAKVTFIACHRPLKRTRLQPMFDRALAVYCTALRRGKRYVVIGLDANQRNPQTLARRCGLRWVSPRGSIDGLLVSKSLKVSDVRRLPEWTSDHHPVVATIGFPG